MRYERLREIACLYQQQCAPTVQKCVCVLMSAVSATKRKKNGSKSEIAPALFLEWLDWHLCNQIIEQVSN